MCYYGVFLPVVLILSFQEDFIVTLSLFGQKDRDTRLNVGDLVNPQAVEELTVHIGVDIEPMEQCDTLLWSRAGLLNLCHRVGKVYPSLSLKDCGSLVVKAREGRDVRDYLDPNMAAVMRTQTYFLQLYNSSPHYRPRDYHSVSGLQAASLCVHAQVSNRIKKLFCCCSCCCFIQSGKKL